MIEPRTIRFGCPVCRAGLHAAGRLGGRVLQCPACSQYVIVPQPADRPSATAPNRTAAMREHLAPRIAS